MQLSPLQACARSEIWAGDAGEDTAFAPLIPRLLRLLDGKGQFQVCFLLLTVVLSHMIEYA